MKRHATKLTRKDFCGDTVISLGYCTAQTLLTGQNRIGYNAGVYGWNWDAFSVFVPSLDKFIYIVTGYRNLIGVRPNYDLVQEYENAAVGLYDKYKPFSEYDKVMTERKNLLIEFCEKVLQND